MLMAGDNCRLRGEPAAGQLVDSLLRQDGFARHARRGSDRRQLPLGIASSLVKVIPTRAASRRIRVSSCVIAGMPLHPRKPSVTRDARAAIETSPDTCSLGEPWPPARLPPRTSTIRSFPGDRVRS